jgi:GTP-binding protein
VLINGIEDIGIGVTVCDPTRRKPLPMLTVDEPTLTMNFWSTLAAGRPRRQVRHQPPDLGPPAEGTADNVALRVEGNRRRRDKFLVSGRGELHLTILLENMRREGYELAVSQARVVSSRKSTARSTSRSSWSPSTSRKSTRAA